MDLRAVGMVGITEYRQCSVYLYYSYWRRVLFVRRRTLTQETV